jgi:hypothetical protein
MSRIAGVLVLLLLAVVVSAGCRRQATPGHGDATAAAAAAGSTGQVPAAAPAALEDVMERDPRYLVGISYPPAARAYPGLARLLEAYAGAARAEVMQAVSGLGDARPTAPYDLSLGFSMLMETPDVVAVAADGSSYTGGAHGNPLVARFVWLPRSHRALTAARLVPDAAGWAPVAAYVRDALATGLSARIDDDAPTPAERTEMLRNGTRMIDEGTAPVAANFDQFEPIAGSGGRLAGLRFVFPPYQVGPYSDGIQSVEVPAAVLLPVIAPEFRALFEGG